MHAGTRRLNRDSIKAPPRYPAEKSRITEKTKTSYLRVRRELDEPGLTFPSTQPHLFLPSTLSPREAFYL